ncbi:unnamed protein product [Notodromas monacha]|uniref:Timeless N-terminal domain-containing protein n=1 Tax=Notodromas monacha TaxID=399045 RepID=A0A7R9BRB3_9CRUS|nr:unnamed protein product [Notodromas monacha]CAG0918890.1 unnamed protein product [Notodromas monacha]
MEMCVHDGPGLHALCAMLGNWLPDDNANSVGGTNKSSTFLGQYTFFSPYMKLAGEYDLWFKIDKKAKVGLKGLLERVKADTYDSGFPVRRTLSALDFARKEVIPFLLGASKSSHLLGAVRLLRALTTPFEALIPTPAQKIANGGSDFLRSEENSKSSMDDVFFQEINGSVGVDVIDPGGFRNFGLSHDGAMIELSSRLQEVKLAFVDARTTKVLVDKLNSMFFQKREASSRRNPGETVKLSDTDRELVYQILMLLRNVLHMETEEFVGQGHLVDHKRLQPDFLALVSRKNAMFCGKRDEQEGADGLEKQMVKPQNVLLGNLFAQHLDDALLELLEHPDLPFWSGPLTEVVSLLYKNQHVSNLQKLVAQWLDSEGTDSTSDDESNTSPVESGNQSSPLLSSSNNGSDSSDSDKPDSGNTPDHQDLSKEMEKMQMSSNDSESSSKSKKPHSKRAQRDSRPFERSEQQDNKPPFFPPSPELRKKRQRSPSRNNKRLCVRSGSGSGRNNKNNKEDDADAFTAPSCVTWRKEDHGKKGVECSRATSIESLDSGAWMSSSMTSSKSMESKKRKPSSVDAAPCEYNPREEKRAASEEMNVEHDDGPAESCRPQFPTMLHRSGETESREKADKWKFAIPFRKDGVKKQQCFRSISTERSNGSGGNSSDEKPEVNEALKGVTQPVSDCPSSTEDDLEKTRNRNVTMHRRLTHQKSSSSGHLKSVSKSLALHKMSPNYTQLLSSRRKHRLAAQRRRTSERSQRASPYPSDDEISLLLRDFTVEFLIGGYGRLVGVLANELPFSAFKQTSSADNSEENEDSVVRSKIATSNVDPAHFFWLITYFLKFATQIPVDFDHLRSVLSPQVVSYLVYQGLVLSEEVKKMSMCYPVGLFCQNSPPFLRSLHLVVTALSEFLHGVDTYARSSRVAEVDKERIRELQRFLLKLRDMRSLLALLVRNEALLHGPGSATLDTFPPSAYLIDLIQTNHIFMCYLPNFASACNQGNPGETALCNKKAVDALMDHLEKLSSAKVVNQYGAVLSSYSTNPTPLNDAVFSLFHHVSVSLEKPQALLQPLIVSTFADMWNTGRELSDEWGDVVALVMRLFIERLAQVRGSSSSDESSMSSGDMVSVFETGEDTVFPDVSFRTCDDMEAEVNDNRFSELDPIVKKVLECSVHAEQWLEWIRTFLTQAACVKMYLTLQESFKAMPVTAEIKELSLAWHKESELLLNPILFFHCLAKKRIPLVPWTEPLERALENKQFLTLLEWLGLDLAAESGGSFPTVPRSWGSEELLGAAHKITPKKIVLVAEDVVEVVRKVNRVPDAMEIDKESTREPFVDVTGAEEKAGSSGSDSCYGSSMTKSEKTEEFPTRKSNSTSFWTHNVRDALPKGLRLLVDDDDEL